MKISLDDIAWKYAPAKVIVSARLEGRNLICDLADKPDQRHRFQPHKTYPQFCTCGYAEHDELVHLPREK